MRGIELKLAISKLPVFDCTVIRGKRDRDVGKLEPNTLKGMFVGYSKVDNGHLVFLSNSYKVHTM